MIDHSFDTSHDRVAHLVILLMEYMWYNDNDYDRRSCEGRQKMMSFSVIVTSLMYLGGRRKP